MLLWLAATLALAAAAAQLPRGVNPAQAVFYGLEDDQFRCLDGSQSIAAAAVNDDFCDCADGSDEPGTAACPQGTFYCANAGSTPLSVLKTWVNDGVCDCCDGSDENNGAAVCGNTCEEHGRALRAQLAAEREVQARGHQLRLEALAQGAARRAEQRARAAQLEGELAGLAAQLASAAAAKAAAEQPEQAAKTAFDEAWAATQAGALAAAKEALFAALDADHDGLLARAEWMRPELDADDDGTVSDEELDAVLGAAPAAAGDGDEEEGQEAPAPPEEAAPLTRETFTQAIFDKAKGRFPNLVAPAADKPAYPAETQTLVAAADTARAAHTQAQAAHSAGERDLSQLRNKLGVDVGAGDEFAALQDECFSVVDGEYTYELCAFDRVAQKSGGRDTSLGTWVRWGEADADGSPTMVYENGERCWNGPARSCTVSLVCGAKNEVLDVVEPNRCEYAMTFATPLMCKTPPAPHDEL